MCASQHYGIIMSNIFCLFACFVLFFMLLGIIRLVSVWESWFLLRFSAFVRLVWACLKKSISRALLSIMRPRRGEKWHVKSWVVQPAPPQDFLLWECDPLEAEFFSASWDYQTSQKREMTCKVLSRSACTSLGFSPQGVQVVIVRVFESWLLLCFLTPWDRLMDRWKRENHLWSLG